jgi:hypothetical protein
MSDGLAEPVIPGPVCAPSYHEWIAEVSAVAAEAEEYLSDRLSGVTNDLAVVLDIDNTALETHYHRWFFGIPPTRPVLRLALLAEARGALVCFVTGRPRVLGPMTRRNLRAAGYRADRLYMRTWLEDLSAFKVSARRDIELRGHTIVANIGNSSWDIANGGHAERGFKLPDYGGELV